MTPTLNKPLMDLKYKVHFGRRKTRGSGWVLGQELPYRVDRIGGFITNNCRVLTWPRSCHNGHIPQDVVKVGYVVPLFLKRVSWFVPGLSCGSTVQWLLGNVPTESQQTLPFCSRRPAGIGDRKGGALWTTKHPRGLWMSPSLSTFSSPSEMWGKEGHSDSARVFTICLPILFLHGSQWIRLVLITPAQHHTRQWTFRVLASQDMKTLIQNYGCFRVHCSCIFWESARHGNERRTECEGWDSRTGCVITRQKGQASRK